MSEIYFKVGDNHNKLEIINVLHSNKCSSVVILEGDYIHFEYKDLPFDESQIMNKFSHLGSRLRKDLPKKLRSSLRLSLAAALSSALLSNTVEQALSNFSSIENRIIRAKTTEQAKSVLIISCFVISSAIAIVLVIFYYIDFLDKKLLFLSMASGVLGSFFSLLQRNRKVHLNHSGLKIYTFIQAAIIAITGAASGIIIYVFCYSNIAFGFAQHNLYALLAICITAGFTERLIPDLFSKIEDLK